MNAPRSNRKRKVSETQNDGGGGDNAEQPAAPAATAGGGGGLTKAQKRDLQRKRAAEWAAKQRAATAAKQQQATSKKASNSTATTARSTSTTAAKTHVQPQQQQQRQQQHRSPSTNETSPPVSSSSQRPTKRRRFLDDSSEDEEESSVADSPVGSASGRARRSNASPSSNTYGLQPSQRRYASAPPAAPRNNSPSVAQQRPNQTAHKQQRNDNDNRSNKINAQERARCRASAKAWSQCKGTTTATSGAAAPAATNPTTTRIRRETPESSAASTVYPTNNRRTAMSTEASTPQSTRRDSQGETRTGTVHPVANAHPGSSTEAAKPQPTMRREFTATSTASPHPRANAWTARPNRDAAPPRPERAAQIPRPPQNNVRVAAVAASSPETSEAEGNRIPVPPRRPTVRADSEPEWDPKDEDSSASEPKEDGSSSSDEEWDGSTDEEEEDAEEDPVPTKFRWRSRLIYAFVVASIPFLLACLGPESLPIMHNLPPCFQDSQVRSMTRGDETVLVPDHCKHIAFDKRRACPEHAFCEGGIIKTCDVDGRGLYQISPFNESCVLTEEANATVEAMVDLVHNWTVCHECERGCPFTVKVVTGRPLFNYSKMEEKIVSADMDYIKAANETSPTFLIESNDGQVLVGLHPSLPLKIPIECHLQHLLSFTVMLVWSILKFIFFSAFKYLWMYPLISLALCVVIPFAARAVANRRRAARERREVTKQVTEMRKEVCEILFRNNVEHQPLHVLNRIAHARFPDSRGKRRYLREVIWPRVERDIGADDRVLIATKLVHGARTTLWMWVDVNPPEHLAQEEQQ